jgi:PAS domain S-box-containing protein
MTNQDLNFNEVDRLRLVEQELRTRLQQQEAVVKLGQFAMFISDLQTLMEETVKVVGDTLCVEFCKVLELLPDGTALLLRTGTGWQEGLVGKAVVGTERDSQAGFTLLSAEPVIVRDLRTEKRFSGPALLRDHHINSGVSVVIPGMERPFGVLGAHSSVDRIFTIEDANFLQSVANLLGSAIVRLRTEQALRTSRDQLNIVLQGVADGITVQDTTGKLVYANQAAAAIIGYDSVEDLLNAPITEIMHKYELYDEEGLPFPMERLPGRLALQGIPSASELVCFKVVETGESHWSLVKATPVLGPSGRVEMAINIFQEVSNLKRAEEAQRLLAEAGRLFTSSLDYEATLASVAQMSVPYLADWCAVHIAEGEGKIRVLAVAHADPKKVELARELQERYPPDPEATTGVANVIRSGEPEFYPEIPEGLLEESARDAEHYQLIRELGIKSALSLPLSARGRVLGALSLVWSEPGRRYTDEDVALAEELARRAALAIDNARLYKEAQSLNNELEARVLKRTTQLQSTINKLRSEIVERRKAEDALRKSETLLQNLFDSAPDATILVSKEGTIEDVNSQVQALFGYKPEELIGKNVNLLLPKRFQKQHTRFMRNFFADTKLRPMGIGRELFGRRKDGSEFQVEILLSPVRVEDDVMVISAVRDITERKRIEAELAEMQRRLIDSTESERIFLAQELHDGPIQDLYVVSYQLKGINGEFTDEAVLESSTEALEHAIAQLRLICGELRPPALAPFGLEKAILAHLDHIGEMHPDLEVDYQLTPDGQILPERTRLALYRIYQHAVSNVVRHANASQLSVRFELDTKLVMLEIQDNGRGFELPAKWVELARQGHLGLVGTLERAESIGGRVTIDSTPGHGTRIQVVVPFQTDQDKRVSSSLSSIEIT